MRIFYNILIATVLLFFLFVNSSPARPSLSGSFLLCSFGEDIENVGTINQSADDPEAALVEIDIDGNGNGIYQELYVSEGIPENDSFTYSIKPNGCLTINAPETTYIHGIMSPDGTIFSLAETTAENPFIDFAIKKSSGMSNGVLQGEYIIIEFADEISQPGSADTPLSLLADVTVDGQGNGTHQDVYVSSGELESGTFTYQVADNGGLTVDSMEHGIVSANGNIFAISLTSDEHPGIIIGVKKSSGMSNSSLKGNYFITQFIDQIDMPGSADDPHTIFAKITMDGQGNGTYKHVYVSSGELESGTFTYQVADNGSLTVDGTDHGIVSPDGSVLAVSITKSDDPGILIGIKKSSAVNLIPQYLLLD